MSRNQSGTQLFEWVKATTKEELPPGQETYHIRWKSRFDERIFNAACGRIGMTRLLVNDAEYIEWLSAAQPSTGKQLPTDDEIENAAEKSTLTGEEYFIQGAKWMRERAQGESDKWIRVEDGLPEADGNYLIVFINSAGRHVGEAYFMEGMFWDDVDSQPQLYSFVSHWQPLPNAPINNNQK